MSDQIELLSVSEVAEELRISETSVYRMMNAGQLPHIKVGVRRYMVSREQLNSFLADNVADADELRAAAHRARIAERAIS